MLSDVSRIQIYGAGIAGTYLYHLLSREGFEVHIQDVRKRPDCRCAWGIEYKTARRLYREIGLNLDDYVLSKPKYIILNDDIWLRNNGVVIFDRRRLLEDLWDFELEEIEDADLIVDATGHARAKLPPIEEDVIIGNAQWIEVHRDLEENIYLYSFSPSYSWAAGYAWMFPLGDDRWHLGAGDLFERIDELILGLRRTYGLGKGEKSCACRGAVRNLPPSRCRPISHGNIYGVGEAIGCTSGLGEGNAPSLISARILADCIISGRLGEYEDRILRELGWIEIEHAFARAIREGRKLRALSLAPRIISTTKRVFRLGPISFLKVLIDLIRYKPDALPGSP